MDNSSVHSSDFEKSSISGSQSKKFVKRLAYTSKVPEPDDDVDLLMKSLALTIKQFPERTIVEAKVKLNQVVCDFQIKRLDEIEKSTRPPSPKILYVSTKTPPGYSSSDSA